MKDYKFIIGTVIGLLGLLLAYLAFSPIISFGKNENRDQKSDIIFKNTGNGPAIIKKVSFKLAGRTYKNGTIEDWSNIVFMTDALGHRWLKYNAILAGKTVKAGDEIYIFYTDKFDPENHRQLSCLIRNLEITVEYNDNIIGFSRTKRYVGKKEKYSGF